MHWLLLFFLLRCDQKIFAGLLKEDVKKSAGEEVFIPPDQGKLTLDVQTGDLFWRDEDFDSHHYPQCAREPDVTVGDDILIYKTIGRKREPPVTHCQQGISSEEMACVPSSVNLSSHITQEKLETAHDIKETEEMPSTSEEAYLKGIAQRTRVKDCKKLPYALIGRLLITYSNNARFLGTGCAISEKHVLTAAHNVYYVPRKDLAHEICFQPGLAGDTAIGNIEVDDIAIPKQYVEAQTTAERKDYDIAILTLKTPYEGMKDSLLLKTIEASPDDDILIAGYPGDLEGGRFMYEETGKVSAFSAQRLFYRINTSPGQSGSNIILIPPARDISKAPYCTIGVHTHGATPFATLEDVTESLKLAVDYNNGLAITPYIFEHFIKPILGESLPE